MNKTVLRIFRFIIVIAIIAVIGFFISQKGIQMLKQKQYDDIRTDMLVIQAKIRIINGKSEVNSNTEDYYVGTKISESENQEIKDFLKSIEIKEEDFDKYYILSNEDMEKMGILSELKNPEENEFIINYSSTDVVYKSGIDVEGNTKYKLSDIVSKE